MKELKRYKTQMNGIYSLVPGKDMQNGEVRCYVKIQDKIYEKRIKDITLLDDNTIALNFKMLGRGLIVRRKRLAMGGIKGGLA